MTSLEAQYVYKSPSMQAIMDNPNIHELQSPTGAILFPQPQRPREFMGLQLKTQEMTNFADSLNAVDKALIMAHRTPRKSSDLGRECMLQPQNLGQDMQSPLHSTTFVVGGQYPAGDLESQFIDPLAFPAQYEVLERLHCPIERQVSHVWIPTYIFDIEAPQDHTTPFPVFWGDLSVGGTYDFMDHNSKYHRVMQLSLIHISEPTRPY